MRVWIAVEGRSDVAVVRALLPAEMLAISSLVPVGGRSNISSVARTLLVKHKEPLAVMVDTDSLDSEAISERYATISQLLAAVAGDTPYKVVLCIPVIEAIFFEAQGPLGRLFPKVDLDSYAMLYKTQPREVLDLLFENGGGPKNLAKLLDGLTDKDVERLRVTGPIRQLSMFIQEVAGAVGRPSAT